ncbi:MAG: hypothetical protein RL385_359 [Pseudomonadota bacterium]
MTHTAFAVLEDGERSDNPRVYVREARRLARAQRVVSRRKRRSVRRRKAVALLAKQHDRIARVRRNFHHEKAFDLVRRFDRIQVEAPNVRVLARSRLAKHVLDAGWAQFVTILASKAECAGRALVRVDPRGTSQECSGCGATVRKSLAVRIHACPECGLVMDRDQNAAINIGKRLGHSRRGGVSNGRPNEPRGPSIAR